METGAPPPQEVHSLRQAPYASLDAKARGECADRLSARLVSDLVAWEGAASKRTNVRRKGLGKLKAAVAAFAADLLHARNHPEADGWVYRPLAKGSFTGKAVSSRDFRSIGDAWTACGLLEHKPGYIKTVEFDPGDPIRTRGKVSRFRATPKLLQTCAEYGVTPQGAGEHFRYPPPEHPLVLTAASRRVGSWKEAGRVLKFKRTRRAEVLERRVKELNDFLDQHVIRGATHRWLKRIFHEGDQPGFDWNKGGRLYSEGKDSYQQLPRPERLKITIDDEPVCELDIRASYLTIIHGLHKEPFKVSEDDDPYGIEGLPRSVVKAWCAVRFGSKGVFRKWPARVVKEYAEDNGGADLTEYRVREVGEKVCHKHPLMKRWLQLPETWADLMWLESEAVVAGMEQLMQLQNAPSLPVHDSLLVPASHEEWAKAYLSTSYRYFCKATPYIEVHHPQTIPPSAPGHSRLVTLLGHSVPLRLLSTLRSKGGR
jgi:hypothetical protein